MPELHLGFIVMGKKTYTTIDKKKESAAIFFKNKHAKDLLSLDIEEVTLPGAKRRRKGRRLRSWHFDIAAGDPPQPFPVANMTPGTALKYTAKIGSSLPEDPIIIIQR